MNRKSFFKHLSLLGASFGIFARAAEAAKAKIGIAPKEKFDFVFADIWHDPSDGIDLYLKLKEAEKLSPQTQYCYWVEKTLKVYIDNLIGDGAVSS